MTTPVLPLHLVPDDARHGVAQHARDIARASGCAVSAVVPKAWAEPLHLHFTERLWGPDPERAAARVAELAGAHRLSVTLHDLPQASDGARSQPRRAAAYARVVAVARGVVCNSLWEAELLAGLGGHSAPSVIPLSVGPLWGPPPTHLGAGGRPVIGVLGFVYPGKGHREAIDAAGACARTLGTGVDVIALGAVSDGHAPDADALRARARALGVGFAVTGYLPADELMAAARRVTVPLAAHQHVSASGSIGSWLTAGRRPLVVDSRYAREIDALRPATIRRYEPNHLVRAVLDTVSDPRASWLTAETDLRPGPPETAAAYRQWWTNEVAW
jgi:hypothetical protein